ITIQASGARVKVLGTKLEVRLVEKPTGRHQTRVRVLSGRVELESAGQKLLLPAGTEGAADEGQPPVRFSLVPEVNDLLALFNETNLRNAESGQEHGLPAIVDLTTATIWTVVPTEHLKAIGPGVSGLRLRYPAFSAKAYTLDGGEIPSEGRGELLRLDLAAAGAPKYLLLKLPGVGGLVQTAGDGRYECNLPANERAPISLMQFRLPASAQVEELPGAVTSTALEGNKLIQTVAARLRLPQLYE
ncbi:MAG TPA: hypothetical protein VNT26_21205, partial [Candidatus Sulfotelmatobacter sp.]|nr:hypothetical protein [Candidatus Sulfotelmatobacter sp.]